MPNTFRPNGDGVNDVTKSRQTFKALSNTESGLMIDGVIRSIQPIGNRQFIFGINNEQVKIYALKQ